MNIILQDLDELLDFHRHFEEYWQPSIPDENGNLVYPTEEGKYKTNVYRSEIKKIAFRHSQNEKHWAKYITDLYSKLKKDGYVIETKGRYLITPDGKIFKGYVSKKRKEIFENIVKIMATILTIYGFVSMIKYLIK